VVIIGIAGSSGHTAQKSLTKILNPIWWINNLTVQQNTVSSGAQRNLYFPLTYQHLQKYAANPMIGMGPGMYASQVVDKFPTRLSALIMDVFDQTKYGMDAGVDSEIIPIWGEFGYLGILLFALFLMYSCFHFRNVYKRILEPEDKGFALTASVGSIFLLIGFYSNKLWETQPVFMTLVIFWALAVQAERNISPKTVLCKPASPLLIMNKEYVENVSAL
jgi:O-antigen ligase